MIESEGDLWFFLAVILFSSFNGATMNAFQWKAAADRVVFIREVPKGDRTTDTGLVLPERVGANIGRGIVVAAGPDAKGVSPGDIILYSVKHALQVDGNVWTVFASEVFAIQRETDIPLEDPGSIPTVNLSEA